MTKRVHTEVSNVRRRVSQRRNGLVAMRSRHERELANAVRELVRAENRLAVLEGRAVICGYRFTDPNMVEENKRADALTFENYKRIIAGAFEPLSSTEVE